MRKDETLHLLRQVKNAEIQGLRHELVQADAALVESKNRYARQDAAEQALALEVQSTRLGCPSALEGKRITALWQQTQYRYLQGLVAALSRAREETALRQKELEQAELRTLALRANLRVLIGQTNAFNGLLEREEQREVLRRERVQDEALAEPWTYRVR